MAQGRTVSSLLGVVSSNLLYTASVWENALENKANNRKAAFRRISDEAAYVTAGMIPFDLPAREGQCLHDRAYFTGESSTCLRQLARNDTAAHSHIYSERIERPDDEAGFNLTQLLSGHGGYQRISIDLGMTNWHNAQSARIF